MKIRMITDYSELPDDPKKGDVLDIFDIEYDYNYEEYVVVHVDYYVCEWQGGYIIIYPYECEEVE